MFVVWRKACTFNRCSKVSTWILGIASRRRLKTLERVDDRTGAVDIDELAGPAECGPEGQFIHQDLRRRLRDAIDALPAEQRRVVMLTYFDGRTYAEIAEIVGCPVNTVKTRMFHARRRLRGDRLPTGRRRHERRRAVPMNGQSAAFRPATHKVVDVLLPWFVNGTLDDEERALVEQHLGQCERCRREVEWLQELHAACAGVSAAVPSSASSDSCGERLPASPGRIASPLASASSHGRAP